ncbi:MAG: 16S rRNA (uracil(1498)-N(3))-methyltransferase [Pseudomonadota bacterium]
MERHVPRLYVSQDLDACLEVSLNAMQSHHLRKVLRLNIGNTISLFNGRDGEWECAFLHDKKQMGAALVKWLAREQESEPECWLLFAPIKPTRQSMLIEKTTELGVTDFFPVITDHCDKTKRNMKRFQDISIAAAQQCGRIAIPKWHESKSLYETLNKWDPTRMLFYCDERRQADTLSQLLHSLKPDKSAILIGPEGGFSTDEFEQLKNETYTKAVSLGPNILRAETAGITAIAVVRS